MVFAMFPQVTVVVILASLFMDGQAWEASSTITPKGLSSKESQKSVKLPPCAACRVLTDSFKKGLERTSRSKFEGGDADWEEKKMGSYKTSEVRLIEIQEHLCSEVDRAQKQCQALAEDHERLLEEWWFEGQAESLHEWLCVGRLAACCPPHHYGPECTPCSGGAEKPCSGHGKCKGDGTRKGNGECQCDDGYNSTLCDVCATGYYESYRDDSKLLCSKCYRACNGPCTGAGPKACAACKEGWRMETEHGCLDVNECISLPDACPGNQFCVNNEGTFTCLMCDKSCNGCDGDGPDMCEKCADGYTHDKEKGMCLDDEVEDDSEEEEDDSEEEEDDSEEEDSYLDEWSRERDNSSSEEVVETADAALSDAATIEATAAAARQSEGEREHKEAASEGRSQPTVREEL